MAETEREPAPGLGRGAQEILGAARLGWRLDRILLAWVAAAPLAAAVDLELPPAGRALVLLAAAVLCLVIGAALCGAAGWEYGRRRRWGLRQCFGLVRVRGLSLAWALASVVVIPALAFATVTTGCLALGRIPGAGPTLSSVWLTVVGLPLTALSAAYLLLALPASVLMVPAACLDSPDAFDVASRSISYVRRRPFRFGAFILAAACAAILAAVVAAVFISVLAALLIVAFLLGTSGGLERLLDPWPQVGRAVLAATDLAWPLSHTLAAPTPPVPELPWLLGLVLRALGRLAPASFLAAGAAALARAYLLLRWEIDGDPPAALVRHDEVFTWSEAAPGRGETETLGVR